jgi:hypothetical protein
MEQYEQSFTCDNCGYGARLLDELSAAFEETQCGSRFFIQDLGNYANKI